MNHPMLPGFLNSLAPLLNHYGYLAVALVVTVESFGPPLPGETLIIAASIYAGAGTLNIWAVFVVALVAAIVGDNIGYAIGHFGGRRVVERYGRYVGATEERFGKAEAFFTKHGGKIVIVARFIEGLRQLNGIIAGTTGMPWRRFAAAQAFGAAVWVAVWCVVGYQAGGHVQAIVDVFSKVGYGLVAALVVAIVAYVVYRRRRAGRGRGPGAEPEEPVAGADQAAGR